MLLFSCLVSFAVFQKSQCFVPKAIRTTSVPGASTFTPSRIEQQLTKTEPIKNNDGGETVLNSNNNSTESFGTLYPRKDDIFPRASTLKLSQSVIESTVDNMLKPSGMSSMGLFGETMHSEKEVEKFQSVPEVGTVLARSFDRTSPTKPIVARMASSMDDADIANLRLSVFSNFNPEARKIFCERSCQLLSSRRQRGATCIVATTGCNDDLKSKANQDHTRKKDDIVGTAEVSFHEFSQTRLGDARPKESILYVTEVAVDASHRRKGIANLMMEAVDALAEIRNVETIYLHVDVTNEAAVGLYERAGYRKLKSKNTVYLEFTTKLNLHDGATKGRNHYLMAKDLRKPTWLTIKEQEEQIQTSRRSLGIEIMSNL